MLPNLTPTLQQNPTEIDYWVQSAHESGNGKRPYLKLDGSIVGGVEGVEEIMCVRAGVCNGQDETKDRYYSQAGVSELTTEGLGNRITSVGEELCVDVFKCVFIDHPAGTLLGDERQETRAIRQQTVQGQASDQPPFGRDVAECSDFCSKCIMQTE